MTEWDITEEAYAPYGGYNGTGIVKAALDYEFLIDLVILPFRLRLFPSSPPEASTSCLNQFVSSIYVLPTRYVQVLPARYSLP